MKGKKPFTYKFGQVLMNFCNRVKRRTKQNFLLRWKPDHRSLGDQAIVCIYFQPTDGSKADQCNNDFNNSKQT